MSISTKTRIRMGERVDDLIAHFGEYVDYLDQNETFVGPSVYFHDKTLALRRRSSSAAVLLESEEFFDYLYATLTAWGLHRMGPSKAKLLEIDKLKASLRSQGQRIQSLWDVSLTSLKTTDLQSVTNELWQILDCLQVSKAQAKLVANSKALHHILPALMPPIDRTHTYKFFFSGTGLGTLGEAEAFAGIYEGFHRVACGKKAEIQARIGKGFHTSETKVLDNAIIGYVRKKLRKTARKV